MDNETLDRISYALGLSMGNNFRASGIKTIDVKDFADGVAAVFEGATPKMTYDEAKLEIKKFFEAMEAEQREAASKMGEVNEKAGKAFLEENGKRVEVKTTPSGLQYEVLEEGTGKQPTAQNQVTVHYTGKLIDGTVFDSSVERAGHIRRHPGNPRMGRGAAADERGCKVASVHPVEPRLRPQRSRQRDRPELNSDFRRGAYKSQLIIIA